MQHVPAVLSGETASRPARLGAFAWCARAWLNWAAVSSMQGRLDTQLTLMDEGTANACYQSVTMGPNPLIEGSGGKVSAGR